MPQVAFDEIPDHGRLWVFPLTRDLTEAEASVVLDEVDRFLAQWAAHGAVLRCARELRDRRFLLVGVDDRAEAPSGCSIDALVNRLRAIGEELAVSMIDHAAVWYRVGDGVESVTRQEFRALSADGQVTRDTLVFDTSLSRISDLRAGKLERPAGETWHGRAFFRDAAPA